jgi:hypothetical protein
MDFHSWVNRNSSYTKDTNVKGLFMLPEEDSIFGFLYVAVTVFCYK